MRVDVLTIFPDYFSPLELSLVGKARAIGVLDLGVHDLREWTHDVHRTVDDTPYGGGPGMVMRPEPWGEAFDALTAPGSRPGHPPLTGAEPVPPADLEVDFDLAPVLVVPTPAGRRFDQAMAHSFAAEKQLIFACGRYEGIDQRVLEEAATRMRVREVSLGDYVLFGGEVAVLVMLEAIVRLLPGVLGNAESLAEESHANGLLEAPLYTKPAVWRERPVPEVLRSGDHGKIAKWRRAQSLLRTAAQRPDMLAEVRPETLDKHDVATLTGAGFPVPQAGVAE